MTDGKPYKVEAASLAEALDKLLRTYVQLNPGAHTYECTTQLGLVKIKLLQVKRGK